MTDTQPDAVQSPILTDADRALIQYGAPTFTNHKDRQPIHFGERLEGINRRPKDPIHHNTIIRDDIDSALGQVPAAIGMVALVTGCVLGYGLLIGACLAVWAMIPSKGSA